MYPSADMPVSQLAHNRDRTQGLKPLLVARGNDILAELVSELKWREYLPGHGRPNPLGSGFPGDKLGYTH